MRRLFKHSILIFVLAISVQPALAQKTLWAYEDLQRIEIETLSDVFLLSSGWMNATNDDVTIQFSRNGLAGVGGAFWPVYINGTQIHLQTWNTQSLYSLPLNLSQLDSVVIIESPMIYEGTFTEKGGIFIYSKEIPEGFSVEGNMSFGNRSGDPGPFVYTEYATPNIERIGPLIDTQMSFKNKYFGARAGVNAFYHSVTDGILQYRRITPFEFGEQRYRHEKIKSIGAYLSANAKTGNFIHNMQAGYNEAADFLFTDIYGVEIPVDRKLSFLSFDGKGEVDRNLDWTYRLSINSNNTQNYPNKDDRWLVWNQNIYSAQTGFEYQFDFGSQKIGAELKSFSLYDDLAGENLNMKLLSFYHRFELQMNSNLSFYSNFMAVKNQKVALKENAGFLFELTDSQSLNLDFSYSSRLPEEDNSLWYWMIDRGFGNDTLDIYQLDELPERTKFVQAGLKWNIDFSKDANLQIGTIYSRNMDEYVFKYQLISQASRIETGTYEFINNLDASFFKIPIEFNFYITPNVYQSLNYTYHHQLSGDEDLFKMMPNHSLSMNINWKPAESFKIWTRIQAQSKTVWNNAEQIDGLVVSVLNRQEEVYSSTSDSRLILDFGIKKYFWNERIALSIDLRNMTDQHFRYHPISQKHTLTLFLKAHLNVP